MNRGKKGAPGGGFYDHDSDAAQSDLKVAFNGGLGDVVSKAARRAKAQEADPVFQVRGVLDWEYDLVSTVFDHYASLGCG
eukprot:4445506-Prymnesium_polylepis.1